MGFSFSKNSSAQGTIEYLVIIAIVIIISLVVVAMLLNTNNSEEISVSSNKVSNLIGQGGISVLDSITGEDGKAVISLQNNSGKKLTILSITPISLNEVEGEEVNCIASFSAGSKENCVLTNVDLVCPCTENETTTCYYKIKYETTDGLIKTEKFKLTNVCVDEINAEPDEVPVYTVTYFGNNNTSGAVPAPTTHSSGSTVTVSANTGDLEKTGYTFSGWNTLANGNGENYTAGSGTFTITSNKTLYAKWEEEPAEDTPPTIDLYDPVEDQEISAEDYDFTFSINQDANQCLVEVNDGGWVTVYDTGETLFEAGDWSINATISDYPGSYYWRVSCSDTNGTWGESQDVNIAYIVPGLNSEEYFIFKITTTSSPQTFSFQTDDASNLEVIWDEENSETFNGTGLRSHAYVTAGDHNIWVKGTATRIAFGGTGTTPDLLKDIYTPISNGVGGLTSAENMFRDTKVSTFTAIDFFDETSTNILTTKSMFYRASFNQSVSNWDTHNLIIMNQMFYQSSFNQPINNWDISNVTDLGFAFMYSSFNQPLNDWNTESVIDMSAVFSNSSFNQPLDNWNTNNVTEMHQMFSNTPFNQDISDWNTSKVTQMQHMFNFATSFNQDISGWDTSKVTLMQVMFNSATSFNQDISGWNTSKVTNMNSMFKNATLFNQNLSGWDVHSVFYHIDFNLGATAWVLPKPSFPS